MSLILFKASVAFFFLGMVAWIRWAWVIYQGDSNYTSVKARKWKAAFTFLFIVSILCLAALLFFL